MNLRELIFLIFFGKGPPFCKKWTKIFFHRNLTIYTPFESPCRVYTISFAFKKFKRVFDRKIVKKFEFLTFFAKSSKSEKTAFLY
jgi:hypothetical protein